MACEGLILNKVMTISWVLFVADGGERFCGFELISWKEYRAKLD